MEVTSAQSTPAMPDITTIAYRVTLNFFAIILLIAAGLRSQAILFQPGSMDATAIAWAEITVEWLLAYWLLTGIAPIFARRVTTAILMDHNCDHCRQILSRQTFTLKQDPNSSAIGMVDFSPKELAFNPPAGIREMHLRQDRTYLADLPIEVSINQNVVESVRQLK